MSNDSLAGVPLKPVVGAPVYAWLLCHKKHSNDPGGLVHLVDVSATFRGPSVCGITPRHGWDLSHLPHYTCERCEAAIERLGITPPKRSD